MIKNFFTRKWVPLFIFALFAAALFIRLGIWQLDRLAQRKEFNNRVLSQINEAIFRINDHTDQSDYFDMEYRQVLAEGEYDFDYQIVIRNQAYENQMGVHLVTPLHLTDSEAVILVDRGWVPYDDFVNGKLEQYNETGEVTVYGIIRRSKERADFGSRTDPTPSPGEDFRDAWFFVNVSGIDQQIPYQLVDDVYIQQSPEELWTGFPARSEADIEISDGPHFSYAIQWFTFALIAVVGVPLMYILQTRKSAKNIADDRNGGSADQRPQII